MSGLQKRLLIWCYFPIHSAIFFISSNKAACINVQGAAVVRYYDCNVVRADLFKISS